ncbi:Mu-like prophage major head subunit gpT family protein [Pseudothauera rhizosphaerae]|uniref:Bacteriophage Mu GpT domain-containing protein n=1 Tax=Pseudothauera rhizosphaerae TaxID=2565932 RepID=A0A4S4AMT1_9RHOO|nr:Mu-like prophage major head subunit gpT family protein [Pseudothauera rhizosphaerae]THF60910.1 hypothetical protein E6O51_11815 [Pseudothauera rhizosphaerae]
MILTPENLRALQAGFNAAFVRGIESVQPSYQQIAMTVTSQAQAENYGWMKDLPGMREWVGPRVINNLESVGAYLENKPWEHTIGVDRFHVEDDRLGIYTLKFSQQGELVARHPDVLTWSLLRQGFTQAGFDGQPFFDADHVGYGQDGNETSWSNLQAGAGAPWFLMDLSRTYLKPLVFQERQRPEFVYKTRPDDDNVFFENQLIFGASARYNAGFGFHQLAFGSRAALDADNYQAGRVALASQYGPDGTPKAVTATHLVVGMSNAAAAAELLQAERNAAGATNIYRGTTQLIVSPYLA